MDEILALTTSQTETMLEEINSYETQSSQEKNDIVLKDISNSEKCTTTCISSQKLCEKKIVHKKVCQRTVPPPPMVFHSCSVNLYNNQQ